MKTKNNSRTQEVSNDLRLVIIPFVKELINKEQIHLKFLEDKKMEFQNLLSWDLFSTRHFKSDIEDAIKISKENLTRLELRLEQYKSYL